MTNSATETLSIQTAAGAMFVLGIDFGGTKVALATADGQGRILASGRIGTRAAEGAAQAVDRAVASARELIAETVSRYGGYCAGAGVVVPGVVRGDAISNAPNLPGLETLAVAAQLREGLGVARAHLANDVKAAGLAEARWGALAGADPAFFLSLGTGIGAALLVGGRVLLGAHGSAGEIGYQLIDVKDRGAAAGRAPLEEQFSGSGLARQAAVLGIGSVPELFASTEAEAVAVVEETLDRLAVHVANLAIALDPQRIAVGGGLMSAADRVLPALERRLREAVPFPPELVPAHFVQDSALHGALALALDGSAVS